MFFLMGYLIILLVLILFFFQNKNIKLIKYGSCFIILSIVSSLIDRVRYKGVLKVFHLFNTKSYGLSFSWDDLGIITGMLLLIFGIFRHWGELTGKTDNRKTYLIDKNYQLKQASIFAFFFMVLGVSLTLFAYFYFQAFYTNLTLDGDKNITTTLLTGMLFFSFIYSIIGFFLVIIYNHRTIGPIFAFERFIEEKFLGKRTELKLREKDHLKHLERIADRINDLMDQIVEDETPPIPPNINPRDVDDNF